jgi:hypothetical protein
MPSGAVSIVSGPVPRVLAPIALLALLATLGLSGCSLREDSDGGGDVAQVGASSEDAGAVDKLGFPGRATRNTTRVSGRDPVADAAGVASAVYPATSPATRPAVVALVDRDDWQGGVAGAVLAGPPFRAPVLLTDGDDLPAVTEQTLDRLKPKGSRAARGSQAILVGDEPPAPEGLKSTAIRGDDRYARAAAVDRFVTAARGEPSDNVVVASGESAEWAMPAAAWAARSGDSVLLTRANTLPEPTRRAIQQHEKPNIFVLGPESVVAPAVVDALRKLGRVDRIEGDTAVENAIAFARYEARGFGWGADQPGRNFTVANQSRPLDAAAAALLGHNGIFAPLLLTDQARTLPRALEGYFLDVQPGFEGDRPEEGVWNHVWILGDSGALSASAQDRVDRATALVPVDPIRP